MDRYRVYIKSLMALYGLVDIDTVVKVYNTHNADGVDRNDIKEYIDDNIKSLEKKDRIWLYKDNFLSYYKVSYMILSDQKPFIDRSIPYYIPCREDILNFCDKDYVEKTTEYLDLHEILTEVMINNKKATKLCDEIILAARRSYGILNINEIYKRYRFKRKGVTGLMGDTLFKRILAVYLSTRMWSLNGHTQNEVDEMKKGV